MRQNLHTLSITALIICAFCAISLAAQEPKLKGKVVPAESPNNPPRLWTSIRVVVKVRATNLEVDGEQKLTQDHTWYHVAPLGARVDVLFDKGPCYLPDGLTDVEVKRDNPDLETVQLQKTRECLIAEKRQRRRLKVISSSRSSETPEPVGRAAAAATTSAASSSGSFARMGEPEPEVSTRAGSKGDLDQLPSPEVLRKDLQREAALARKGEFFDSFQYNFALKWEIYGDTPSLMEVLTRFRSDAQNQDLFKQLGNVTFEMFNDTVRAQFELSEQVNLDNIKRVIQDEGLSPNVRGSATVALLNLKLDNRTLGEMREYYRQQTQSSSSEIFATSLVALARIGESGDEQNLYDYVLNSQNQHRVIAMEALATAQLIEGPGTWPSGVRTLAEVARKDEDPRLRAAAVFALRPFAYHQDETAITTLLSGAKDPSSKVRIEAIWALSVGETENQPRVRRLLWSVAKTDRSPFVRRAANLSLTGPSRLGRSIRYEW